jgi:hypothetical protein
MPPRPFLPRTVLVLGIVSFLNDTASEMVAPLLPLFITTTLGGGAVAVGLIEGVAEATASVLKVVSGWLADRGWDRKGLVVGGYGVSNAARPVIGVATAWGWVGALRFLDRVGKGIRTPPRDTLIAAAVDTPRRGRAFGFHRALDHAGAMTGPIAAFLLLRHGMEMGHVFFASALPGALVVLLLIIALRSPPGVQPDRPTRKFLRWRTLDGRLRALILASGGLALATTPEAFLVLWAGAHGMQVAQVPLVWAAAHAVKALVATPAGMVSDRVGRLPVVAVGWTARVVALVGLAVYRAGGVTVWLVFLAYAASLAITEAPERALVGDAAPADQRATAYGLYHLVCGVLALPGAVVFGWLWQTLGETTAFATAAGLTATAAVALLWLVRGRR